MEMRCLDRDGKQIEVAFIVAKDPDYLDYKLYKQCRNGEYQLKRICSNYDEVADELLQAWGSC